MRRYQGQLPQRPSQRVLLSLPPDLYNTVTRLSKAMSKPRAEIIRELLGEMKPALEIMADGLEQAKKGQKRKALLAMQKMTGEALKELAEAISPTEPKAK